MDGTWYDVLEPATKVGGALHSAPDSIPTLLGSATFLLDGVEQSVTSAPTFISCTANAWDAESFDTGTVSLYLSLLYSFIILSNSSSFFLFISSGFTGVNTETSEAGANENTELIGTSYGDITIKFDTVTGLPTELSAMYSPRIQKIAGDTSNKLVTFKVTSFDASNGQLDIPYIFDNEMCEEKKGDNSPPSSSRKLEESKSKYAHLSKAEGIAAATIRLEEIDAAERAYRAQFGSARDEGFSEAIQMDRNLNSLSDSEQLVRTNRQSSIFSFLFSEFRYSLYI
jgi:hypothetical protein